LIVGGGPCGTAAAMRAKELGLTALVIELDDVLKRIRDYAKDKLILPGFGGGDKMKFPVGDRLVKNLHFQPIDKDEMHRHWKSLYVEHSVPAKVGIELTGMERDGDIWRVRTWNHRCKEEEVFRARHVLIGVGRGVPRRFDIPGNTDGIAFRLDDPAAYVGGPACVIGGGTSAAEAVVAISHKKVEADDPTAVYWATRGARMPKVSKALADVVFTALIENGNIRFRPNSGPVAVVTAPDRNEYLSIITDRRTMEGRPPETTHLEFPKTSVVACIGEDLPEALLNSLGIHMATGGPKGKKRMVVTPLLETQQPNVYLVGEILSPAYFVTDDFDADPAGFQEVKRRGNVKSALRDGVYAIEVVKQRLEGVTDVKVTLAEVEGPAEQIEEAASAADAVTIIQPGPGSEGPPAASEPEERQVEEAAGWLVRVTPGGVTEDEFRVEPNGLTTIGRKGCDISIPDDERLADHHASISHREGEFFLRDDGGADGVFLRAPEAKQIEVEAGSLVRAGRQYLLFEGANGTTSFTHYDQNGSEVGRHPIADKTVVLGRDAPDITLDAADRSLSRRHLAVSRKEGKTFVRDLKSINGTYIKVRNSIKIEDGARFRVGRQEFIFTLRDDAVIDATPSAVSSQGAAAPSQTGAAPPAPAKTGAGAAASEAPEQAAAAAGSADAGGQVAVEEPAEAGEQVAAAAAGAAAEAAAPAGLTITFKNLGKELPFEPGQTICQVAEQNGIELNAECHAGACGSDPIRIISGAENLNTVGEGETEALEDICELEPGKHRLACMSKPTGPVVIEVVQDE
ncbi:MAG: FHA domain-containing protein, partial [Candidatus Eiseniibacteriota bacterium]